MDVNLTAHMQSRRLDITPDDSSSVTSRTSSNNPMKCKTCGEPESLPSKPLVKCPSCQKKRWHAYCHQPQVDARKIPEGWKCKACINDSNHPTGSSFPSVSSKGPSAPSPPPSILPESSINMSSARLCKEPGCKNPIFQTAIQLCTIHSIQQKYRNATTKKPGELVVAPGYKPIKKNKLYNFKLDDDPKQLKRKRAAPAKRSVSDPRVPALASNAATQPQKLQEQDSLLAVHDGPSAKTAVQQTPEQRGRQFNLVAGIGSEHSPPEEDFNLSLGSESMAESPISLLNADLEGDYLIPNSARRTPQSTGRRPSPSPEYSPPPPITVPPHELNSLWADPDDSPGSQINQELRARVDPDITLAADQMELDQSPLVAALNSIQEERDLDLAEEDLHAIEDDEDMPDLYQPAVVDVDQTLRNHPAPQRSPSPAVTSVSSSTTSAEDIILESNAASSDAFESAQSLEAKRKQKAATFDTSELDCFLTKQSEPESEIQPTPQELANAQMWGHIDPRDVWPQQTSEEWYDEKRREIDARGGRKANFRKHLTAQVRKERMEKGWYIHQNSEAVPGKIMAETARHMEELFGIKGIDDLLPCVRNGELAMIDKPFDENGRKKRKGMVKVYPVA